MLKERLDLLQENGFSSKDAVKALSLALEDRDNGVRQTTVALGFRVRF